MDYSKNNINKEEYYILDSKGEINMLSFKGFQLYLLLIKEEYLQKEKQLQINDFDDHLQNVALDFRNDSLF